MFKKFGLVVFPLLTCLAALSSILLVAPEAANANEREREISSWSIAYSGGWFSSEGAGFTPRDVVNSVTMRRNNGRYDVFFHYTLCSICVRTFPKKSYFSVDEEKAQQIAALVDEAQIKAALERPCTLPSANARLSKVTVKLDPPPAGYAPFAYDILLGCQSPELDAVKGNLDAAMKLFSMWMEEQENQAKP